MSTVRVLMGGEDVTKPSPADATAPDRQDDDH